MKKYSKQREMILESLRDRTDHPSAEMLYEDLKKGIPNIGIATVYRNLGLLYEQGEILKILEQDSDRYDGNTTRHLHFICKTCSKIEDIFLEEKKLNEMEENIRSLTSNLEAAEEEFKITIMGQCKDCKNKQNEEEC